MSNKEVKNVNIEAELLKVKEGYEKLTTEVEKLQKVIELLMERPRVAVADYKTPKAIKSKKEIKQESKLIEVKKLDFDGKEIEVYVYDTFVVVDGHKRKIYEVKKGNCFSYEGKTVYLKFNSLQAV